MSVDHEIPEKVMKVLSGLQETSALYLKNPYQRKFEANIVEFVISDGFCYVVLDRTCFFPEGGGQPGDVGTITSSNGSFKVVDTQAIDNIVIHISPYKNLNLNKRESIQGSIDWKIRYERMKQHTASHLIFSSTRRVLDLEKLMYMGVQINEDTSRIDISYGKPIDSNQIHELEKRCNQVILENRTVNASYMTRSEAEEAYGKMLGLTEITPSGKVRVIEVEGWDVALCSGTHVSSTAEIGLVNILDRFRLKKGVERIEFTAGKHAYQLFIESRARARMIAQTLQTSITEAPLRVENLLKERNRLKDELGKLQEQLMGLQITELQGQAEVYGEYKLLKKELQTPDSENLRRISTRLTELDPYLITLLGSRTNSTTFIVGSAGEVVVRAGLNMANAIKDVTSLIQGGGGGNARLAQAGGRAPKRLNEALKILKQNVLLQLQKI